jgi:glutamyl-tRNA synthetase
LNLDKNTIENNLKNNIPHVIRQKIPQDGKTTFKDLIFGEISVENKEIEDQILIKSDGYPTYNFANVVDDHLMQITHVIRGTEYLSSTPKYDLLYKAFGWQLPKYIHLPLILGKNLDGSTSKLSKRHGAVGFFDLLSEGYLPEAIINYIALLGWAPPDENEFFTLGELIKIFSIERINKSPSIFNYDKLKWFNAEYIRKKTLDELIEIIKPILDKIIKNRYDCKKIAAILQPRITKLSEIPGLIKFLNVLPNYENELFINKKSKTNFENSYENLKIIFENLKNVNDWSFEALHDKLMKLAKNLKIKNGTLLFPLRIALSGQNVTCGGAIEILNILGKQESLNRINLAIKKLQNK